MWKILWKIHWNNNFVVAEFFFKLCNEQVWFHVVRAVCFLLCLDAIFKDSCVNREDKINESVKKNISVFDKQLIHI